MRSSTLRKTPRLMRSLVIFPKNRSTRFSQDEEVGMKYPDSRVLFEP